MKFLIIFGLTLATALALSNKDEKSRNIIVPAGIPEGRITHGSDAWKGQFPYQVGLALTDQSGLASWCGGVLISNTQVLTAAHCTEDAVKVQVRLGAVFSELPAVSHEVYPQDIVIHEEYNEDTVQNDISLIKIPYTRYTDTIQPVNMPTKSSAYSSYIGKTAVASGWGRISDNFVGAYPLLQFARLTIISNNICGQFLRMNSTNICTATYGGVSICHGDSGGPLVLESSKTLVGLASAVYSLGCESRYPAIFTRVASYLDWIKQHSNQMNSIHLE